MITNTFKLISQNDIKSEHDSHQFHFKGVKIVKSSASKLRKTGHRIQRVNFNIIFINCGRYHGQITTRKSPL